MIPVNQDSKCEAQDYGEHYKTATCHSFLAVMASNHTFMNYVLEST